MNLTTEEWNILATRHANSFEASQLRNKLMEEGYHFCSCCKTVQLSDNFVRSAKGRGGRSNRCKRCSLRKNKTRTSGYVAHGSRSAENSARFRKENPTSVALSQQLYNERHMEKIRERDRNRVRVRTYDPVKARERYQKNREAILERAAERRAEHPGVANAAKRKTFDKRKALGMTGRQANHMSDSSEFYDEWNAIKGAA